MRKIRNAAFAGIATLSLVAGMTTAAYADEAPKDGKGSSMDSLSSSKKKDGSEEAKQSDAEGWDVSSADVVAMYKEILEKDSKGEALTDKEKDLLPSAKLWATEMSCYKTDEFKKLDLNKYVPGNPDCETRPLWKDVNDLLSNPTNSSVLGKRYNGNRDVTGKDLLGSTVNYERQPRWAQIWLAVTVLGVIGSVVGLMSLPWMNELKARGIVI